jgi:hypothetical protein
MLPCISVAAASHLAQQMATSAGYAPGRARGGAGFLPAFGQAYQHAAHGQALEHELCQFGQSLLSENQRQQMGSPIFFKPA